MKQLIEVDVPDGYKVCCVELFEDGRAPASISVEGFKAENFRIIEQPAQGVVAPVADTFINDLYAEAKLRTIKGDDYAASFLGEAASRLNAMQKLADDEPARFEAWFMERATKEADMFWDRDNPEQSHDSIEEFVNHAWEQGASIGSEFNVMCAMSLPDVSVRLLWSGSGEDDVDGETTYELIAAAPINHSSDVGK